MAVPATAALTAPALVARKDAEGRRVVDLMPLIDPKMDVGAGKWEIGPQGLVSDGSDQATLSLRYEPPQDYDFRIEFTRVSGNDAVVQQVVRDNRQGDGAGNGDWLIGGEANSVLGLEYIGSHGISDAADPARVVRQSVLENGRRYTSVVRVRNSSISAALDDQTVGTFPVDWRDVQPLGFGSLCPGRLGLASSRSSVVFHKVEVTEIAGQARIIRARQMTHVSSGPSPRGIIATFE